MAPCLSLSSSLSLYVSYILVDYVPIGQNGLPMPSPIRNTDRERNKEQTLAFICSRYIWLTVIYVRELLKMSRICLERLAEEQPFRSILVNVPYNLGKARSLC